MARGIWPLAGLVLLGHALALHLLTTLPHPASLAGEAAPAPGPIFQVRAVRPLPAAPGPGVTQAPPPGSAGQVLAPAPAPAPATLSPAPGTVPSAAARPPADLPYLPRDELTQAPRPLRPVDVPFPDVGGVVDLKVQLTLFIDERGMVQRVRIDTPDVAPVFEQAIRDAFRQAPFAPGTLRDAAVRSQLPIEVEFKGEAPRRR